MTYLVVGIDHASLAPWHRTSRRAAWPAPRAGRRARLGRGDRPRRGRRHRPGLDRARAPGERAGRRRARGLTRGLRLAWSACSTSTPRTARRASHLHAADEPAGALVLGHGAGGGVDGARPRGGDEGRARGRGQRRAGRAALPRRRPALARARRAARRGLDRGRRAPARGRAARPAARRRRALVRRAGRLPHRRAQTGAVGVLCLAFPVHPPGRPEKTRLPELDAVTVPALVVQGAATRSACRRRPGPHGRHGPRQPLPHRRSRRCADAVRGWWAGLLGLPD